MKQIVLLALLGYTSAIQISQMNNQEPIALNQGVHHNMMAAAKIISKAQKDTDAGKDSDESSSEEENAPEDLPKEMQPSLTEKRDAKLLEGASSKSLEAIATAKKAKKTQARKVHKT